MSRQIFVNLPIKDLKKTVAFFTQLGFTFNPQFTDDNAACMNIGENIYAMLLAEKFFKTFTEKEICNTGKSMEVINALQLESKEEVDTMIQKVGEAGGTVLKTHDHGWMYTRAFEDLDGHSWEAFWMDPKGPPKA